MTVLKFLIIAKNFYAKEIKREDGDKLLPRYLHCIDDLLEKTNIKLVLEEDKPETAPSLEDVFGRLAT